MDIDPYVTLRGHTSPIMAMCGYQGKDSTLSNIVVSGGTNGNIMIWSIPSKKEVEDSQTADLKF